MDPHKVFAAKVGDGVNLYMIYTSGPNVGKLFLVMPLGDNVSEDDINSGKIDIFKTRDSLSSSAQTQVATANDKVSETSDGQPVIQTNVDNLPKVYHPLPSNEPGVLQQMDTNDNIQGSVLKSFSSKANEISTNNLSSQNILYNSNTNQVNVNEKTSVVMPVSINTPKTVKSPVDINTETSVKEGVKPMFLFSNAAAKRLSDKESTVMCHVPTVANNDGVQKNRVPHFFTMGDKDSSQSLQMPVQIPAQIPAKESLVPPVTKCTSGIKTIQASWTTLDTCDSNRNVINESSQITSKTMNCDMSESVNDNLRSLPAHPTATSSIDTPFCSDWTINCTVNNEPSQITSKTMNYDVSVSVHDNLRSLLTHPTTTNINTAPLCSVAIPVTKSVSSTDATVCSIPPLITFVGASQKSVKTITQSDPLKSTTSTITLPSTVCSSLAETTNKPIGQPINTYNITTGPGPLHQAINKVTTSNHNITTGISDKRQSDFITAVVASKSPVKKSVVALAPKPGIANPKAYIAVYGHNEKAAGSVIAKLPAPLKTSNSLTFKLPTPSVTTSKITAPSGSKIVDSNTNTSLLRPGSIQKGEKPGPVKVIYRQNIVVPSSSSVTTPHPQTVSTVRGIPQSQYSKLMNACSTVSSAPTAPTFGVSVLANQSCTATSSTVPLILTYGPSQTSVNQIPTQQNNLLNSAYIVRPPINYNRVQTVPKIPIQTARHPIVIQTFRKPVHPSQPHSMPRVSKPLPVITPNMPGKLPIFSVNYQLSVSTNNTINTVSACQNSNSTSNVLKSSLESLTNQSTTKPTTTYSNTTKIEREKCVTMAVPKHGSGNSHTILNIESIYRKTKGNQPKTYSLSDGVLRLTDDYVPTSPSARTQPYNKLDLLRNKTSLSYNAQKNKIPELENAAKPTTFQSQNVNLSRETLSASPTSLESSDVQPQFYIDSVFSLSNNDDSDTTPLSASDCGGVAAASSVDDVNAAGVIDLDEIADTGDTPGSKTNSDNESIRVKRVLSEFQYLSNFKDVILPEESISDVRLFTPCYVVLQTMSMCEGKVQGLGKACSQECRRLALNHGSFPVDIKLGEHKSRKSSLSPNKKRSPGKKGSGKRNKKRIGPKCARFRSGIHSYSNKTSDTDLKRTPKKSGIIPAKFPGQIVHVPERTSASLSSASRTVVRVSSKDNVAKKLNQPPVIDNANKFYHLKIDGKNILIPCMNFESNPKAFILNDGKSNIPLDSLSPILLNGPNLAANVDKANSVAERIKTRDHIKKPNTGLESSNSTRSLAPPPPPSQQTSVNDGPPDLGPPIAPIIKEEPTATGYGDVACVNPPVKVKSERLDKGYSDEPSIISSKKKRPSTASNGDSNDVSKMPRLEKMEPILTKEERISSLKKKLLEQEQALELLRKQRLTEKPVEIDLDF